MAGTAREDDVFVVIGACGSRGRQDWARDGIDLHDLLRLVIVVRLHGWSGGVLPMIALKIIVLVTVRVMSRSLELAKCFLAHACRGCFPLSPSNFHRAFITFGRRRRRDEVARVALQPAPLKCNSRIRVLLVAADQVDHVRHGSFSETRSSDRLAANKVTSRIYCTLYRLYLAWSTAAGMTAGRRDCVGVRAMVRGADSSQALEPSARLADLVQLYT